MYKQQLFVEFCLYIFSSFHWIELYWLSCLVHASLVPTWGYFSPKIVSWSRSLLFLWTPSHAIPILLSHSSYILHYFLFLNFRSQDPWTAWPLGNSGNCNFTPITSSSSDQISRVCSKFYSPLKPLSQYLIQGLTLFEVKILVHLGPRHLLWVAKALQVSSFTCHLINRDVRDWTTSRWRIKQEHYQ